MAKVGRPKKTIDDLNLPKDWQSIALDLYRNGKSDVHVRVELDINQRQFYNLIENNEQFRTTIKKGNELSLIHWMDIGEDYIEHDAKGINLNTANYQIQMRNRFGWDRESKLKIEHSGQITHKNIDSKIKELSDKTTEQIIAELNQEIDTDLESESQS